MADASWTRWRPEVAKACDGSHHTIESIEANLAAGTWQVLTQPDCCYIVEVQTYPTETACQIWWAAGTLPAIIAGLTDVHTWAKLQGCTEMLVEGQPAWKRALAHLDYGVWSVTLRKAL